MVKFLMKCFLLTSILLFGIILGMQQANQGIKEMKGYNDPSIATVIQVKEMQSGEIEAAILGQKVSSQSIEEKKQQLEQIETFNLFSSVGKKLSAGVTIIFEKMIGVFSAGVERLLG